MKIKRDLLIRHLSRISCSGQIPEAIFTDAFATIAMSADTLLLVNAPGMPATDVLDEEVGLPDISKLMKALKVLAGDGPQGVDVEVRVEEHRLVVDEGHRGIIRLLTAAPKTIATRIEPETAQKVLAKAPTRATPKAGKKGKAAQVEEGVIALTQALISGVQSTFSLFKASEVELFVGPKGGKIRVGNDNADVVEFESDALVADEEYSLLFGSHLIDVLGVVTDFSEAYLILGGPDTMITVQDGAYQYLLSPRSKGAEAK